jgi:hypothetical protein
LPPLTSVRDVVPTSVVTVFSHDHPSPIMAITRRAFLPLPTLLALAGCTGLNNDQPELAIENRSNSEQNVVVSAYPLKRTAEGTPEVDYEGTVPPGSRALIQDVVPAAPAGGSLAVEVDVETGSYATVEEISVTGPGTIDIRITRNGLDVFFAAKD